MLASEFFKKKTESGTWPRHLLDEEVTVYGSRDLWKIDEAVALCLGLRPWPSNRSFLKQAHIHGQDAFYGHTADPEPDDPAIAALRLERMIREAIATGALEAFEIDGLKDHVQPSDFIEWVITKPHLIGEPFALPPKLREIVVGSAKTVIDWQKDLAAARARAGELSEENAAIRALPKFKSHKALYSALKLIYAISQIKYNTKGTLTKEKVAIDIEVDLNNSGLYTLGHGVIASYISRGAERLKLYEGSLGENLE